MANGDDTLESAVDKLIAKVEQGEQVDNGDLFDEDSNDALANIELVNNTPPAKLAIYCNGFMYVYSITGRYVYEKEEDLSDIKLTEL